MNCPVLNDEYGMCADTVKKWYKSQYRCGRAYTGVCVVSDKNHICDYMMYAISANNSMNPLFQTLTYLKNAEEATANSGLLQETDFVVVDRIPNEATALFFFSNCSGSALELLERALAHLRSNRQSRCLVTILLPEYPAFPGEIEKMAEREFDYYIEKECPHTPKLDVYLQLMALCRQAVREEGLNLSVLRFSNVFGPDFVHMPGVDLEGIVRECCSEKKMRITDDDARHYITVSYVRAACDSVFCAMTKAKKGHVYNADDVTVSVKQLKELIYECDKENFSLAVELSECRQTEKFGLSSLKLEKRGIRHDSFLKTGIRHLVSYMENVEYDTSENVEFYDGKISTIQMLELEILKKIDEICRENDIRYFLAGGTLLGAVRSGGFIPWDDDLDIGMLRDDFEKFRRVCKGTQEGEFSYSCGETGTHYTIDKIRLNDTYFSTNFSAKNVFPDGVFVDLLIYDKTSNNKTMQKLHSWILTVLTTLIYIRWYNAPRKDYHYRFSKWMLPLLRLVPWKVYHGLFDFFARLYRNKKDAKWLIDSVGKKVHGAPLPNKGLDEVVYVDFAGMQAPIPVDPAPYLNYAYGPTYMQLPPLSKRRCPHNFARIDLGRYVFGYEKAKNFRKVDIRGELYESESV